MSNDLISRKALINTLFVCNRKMCPDNDIDNFPITINVKNVKEAIRNAPTAYDVDKVVRQISDLVKSTEQYRHNFCGTVTDEHCANYENCEHCIVEKIVKIVKSGGIE